MRKQKELDEKMRKINHLNKTLEVEVKFLRNELSYYSTKCNELQNENFKNLGDVILWLNKNMVADALDYLNEIYEKHKKELFAKLEAVK